MRFETVILSTIALLLSWSKTVFFITSKQISFYSSLSIEKLHMWWIQNTKWNENTYVVTTSTKFERRSSYVWSWWYLLALMNEDILELVLDIPSFSWGIPAVFPWDESSPTVTNLPICSDDLCKLDSYRKDCEASWKFPVFLRSKKEKNSLYDR